MNQVERLGLVERSSVYAVRPIINGFLEQADRERILASIGGNPTEYDILSVRQQELRMRNAGSLKELFYGRIAAELPLGVSEDAADVYIVDGVSRPYSGWFHSMFVVDAPLSKVHPERPKNFGDLLPTELTNFHSILYHSLTRLATLRQSENQLLPVCGFNFGNDLRSKVFIANPETGDMETLSLSPENPTQALWAIHGHLVGLTTDELSPLPILSKKDRRKLADPLLPQAIDLYHELIYKPVSADFFELLTHCEIGYQTKVDTFPKGILFRFPARLMQEERFSLFLQALHKRAEEVYARLMTTVVDEALYERGILQPIPFDEAEMKINKMFTEVEYKGFKGLQPKTVSVLRRYLLSLPTYIADMAQGYDARNGYYFTDIQKAQAFVNGLGNVFGPNYNLVYAVEEDRDTVDMLIVPQLTSGETWLGALGILKDSRMAETPEDTSALEALYRNNASLTQEMLAGMRPQLLQ
jgi:hypothetical protein